MRSNWREVHARAKRLAKALTARGVKPGDRIATLAWNSHRHLELYYAVSGIGAVLHTVNRLFPEQLVYILNHAEDTHLFFDAAFMPLIEKLRAHLPTVKSMCCSGTKRRRSGHPGVISYESFCTATTIAIAGRSSMKTPPRRFATPRGRREIPKGVLYSHRSTVLHALASCMSDVLGLSSREHFADRSDVPRLRLGRSVFSRARRCQAGCFRGRISTGPASVNCSSRKECTLSLGVPTVWLGMLGYLDKHPDKKPQHLRRMLIGGSAAARSLVRGSKASWASM